MFKNYVILLVLFLVGCSHAKVIVPFTSVHLAKSSDNINPGLGVKVNKVSVVYVDNSRKRESYSTAVLYDIGKGWEVGAAYYDSKSGYKSSVKPILGKWLTFNKIQMGFIIPDIIAIRLLL